MRVFVTGAIGLVGSVVAQDLIQAGHMVLGLASSEAGAKSLLVADTPVHWGDVEELESLRKGAAMS